jgi:folate-binding protein YgfZ
MQKMDIATYNDIRSGRAGFYVEKRGLIAVHGKEAVQFLDGLVTNDMKTLADGRQMLAAFPNAQGRLLAVVRIQRQGEQFLIETEDATREKLFQNLFRFTFAGDFFAEDLSDQFSYFEVFGPRENVFDPDIADMFPGSFAFEARHGASYFIPVDQTEKVRSALINENECVVIDDELYEVLRIESGIPKFGADMDETTIVPELGLDEMISYTKGCYIGQEIIARIHFRGHVAKRLTGLVVSDSLPSSGALTPGAELFSADGKNAGKVASTTFSPKLERMIGLAFVRYDFLAEGTELAVDDLKVNVKALPFVS